MEGNCNVMRCNGHMATFNLNLTLLNLIPFGRDLLTSSLSSVSQPSPCRMSRRHSLILTTLDSCLRQFPSACKARILYVILPAIDAYVALGWKDFNLLIDQTHAEDMVYLRWVCTDSEAPIDGD